MALIIADETDDYLICTLIDENKTNKCESPPKSGRKKREKSRPKRQLNNKKKKKTTRNNAHATSDVSSEEREEISYDSNHNKRVHKLANRVSNNKGKNKRKNVQWKFNFSKHYRDNLGNVNAPRWKAQIADCLSNCVWKRVVNRSYSDQRMNNFTIYI